MIKQRCEAYKLAPTLVIRAVVQFLTMRSRIDVLIQPLKARIHAMAEVALITVAVVCGTRDGILDVGVWISQKVLGEDTVGVALSDRVVELLTVQIAGVGA